MTIEIEIRAVGIPAALRLLESVNSELIAATLKDSLEESTKIGKTLMALHVADSIRTEKSTGALADSIDSILEQKSFDEDTGVGVYQIRIGSALEHAKYAARVIGWSAINRRVFIDPPGRWRFIGIRPPMPAHPFLEFTAYDMISKVIPNAFRENWVHHSKQLQVKVDELQGVE